MTKVEIKSNDAEYLYQQFGISLERAKEISAIVKEHTLNSERPEILIRSLSKDIRLEMEERCFACFYVGLSIGEFTGKKHKMRRSNSFINDKNG